MSKLAIATIITADHLDKALAAYESISRFSPDIPYHILVVDHKNFERIHYKKKNITIHTLADIQNVVSLETRLLCNKYGEHLYKAVDKSYYSQFHKDVRLHPSDCLRWSLKPVLLRALLKSYDMVMFTDCDLFFYEDFRFLVQNAEPFAMTLSPHWRNPFPGPISNYMPNEFIYNYVHGIYNAGFLIVTKLANKILEWWTEMVIHNCAIDRENGVFVDQKYLDIVPIYFKDVDIIKHYGCNVATWNKEYLKRSVEDGKVFVTPITENDKWPVVFVHYSGITINHIESGLEPQLDGLYEEYYRTLTDIRRELVRLDLKKCISIKLND